MNTLTVLTPARAFNFEFAWVGVHLGRYKLVSTISTIVKDKMKYL